MGKIRMTRITYGSGKGKSKTIKIHKNSSKKNAQKRCPGCGRYI